MKKGLFWKVIASLFMLWLFLFLWMNQWHYAPSGIAKTNKITGKIYHIVGDKWRPLQQAEKKTGEE
jgi:hypothetical protein